MIAFVRPKGFGIKSLPGITSKMKTPAVIVRSDRLGEYEFFETTFRWGYSGPLDTEDDINSVDAMKFVQDKRFSRYAFANDGLAPPTWLEADSFEFWSNKFPVVIRPKSHKQGKDFYFCTSYPEIKAAILKINGPYYISEYIEKAREFRVIVAQGRAVLMYEKIPDDPSKHAWNHAQGATTPNMKFSTWHMPSVDAAITAMEIADLTVGAVDVMIDAEGNPYVLEINTAPETTSEYRQTCFAKVFDYISENGFDDIESDPCGDSWKHVIHPAISPLAIV